MEFRVLGPMEVTEGERLLDVGPRMHRAVLALLVMQANRVVSVDHLLDQLWGDEPPATAANTLQGYVAALRRALEPDRRTRTPPRVLLTQPPGYLLRVTPEAIDAARFETLVGEGREQLAAGRCAEARDVLGRALALWRGEPYADLAYERFVQFEAARLLELRASAAEDLAEALLAAGDHAGALTELEGLVASQPLRERRWELYVLALYRCGRQADALRAFSQVRRILGEELGIEPRPSLRRLEQEILQQSSSLEWRDANDRRATAPARPFVLRTAGTASVADTDQAAPGRGQDRIPFVGRDRELRHLLEVLDDAVGRPGRVALIAGEPGVGKTRLAEELAAAAEQAGVQVAWGRCHEGGGAPAYWPWLQIIRTCVTSGEEEAVREALGGSVEIAQIVPEVKEFLADGVEFPYAFDAESARLRLYDAVIGFVLRVAAIRPLVLVFDDLQWADVASLRLLELAAGELDRGAILVVATYRDVCGPEGGPFVATLARFARLPDVVRIRLGGLTAADVASVVAATTGADPDECLASAIHSRSDGNPFFVRELVRLLESQGQLTEDVRQLGRQDIPEAVRDVIRLRLAGLPDGADALLRVASVVGRDFSLPVAAAAARLSEDRSLDVIEAALARGLVTEGQQTIGHFRFTHDLVRQTLYEELTALRRAQLHLHVGDALELAGGTDAVELAHHFWLAASVGGAERALDNCQRAAAAAMDQLAYELAEEHLQRAVALLERLPHDDQWARRNFDLHSMLWRVLYLNRGQSVAEVGQASARLRELSREVGDPRQLVPALFRMGWFHAVRDELDVASELGTETVAAARRTAEPPLLTLAYRLTGGVSFFQGRFADGRRLLEAAVTHADACGDDAEVISWFAGQDPGAHCRGPLALCCAVLGDETAAHRFSMEAVQRARIVDRPFALVHALLTTASAGAFLHDIPLTAERAEEVVALCEEHRFRGWEPWARVLRGWARAMAGGGLAAAAESADGAARWDAVGGRVSYHCFVGLAAEAMVRAGDADEALRLTDLALGSVGEFGGRYWESELHRVRGEALASAGKSADDAEDALRRAIAIADRQGAVLFSARAGGSLNDLDRLRRQ